MKKTIIVLLCSLIFLTLNFTVPANASENTDNRDYIQDLIRLEIIDADDIRVGDCLTNTECFNFILRAVGANDVYDLEDEWKYRGFKRLLGDRPDWQKEII